MSRFFILSTLLILSFSSGILAQTYRVNNAIEFYNSGSFIEAHDELTIAKGHPRSILYPDLWAYDFLISQELAKSAPDVHSRHSWVLHMADAYSRCAIRDTSDQFLPRLKPIINKNLSQYRLTAFDAFVKNSLADFMIHYECHLALAEVLNQDVNIPIYQLAELAKREGNKELAIKHYEMATKAQFETQLAFVNWISLLRVNKRPLLADSVQEIAQSQFPKSDISGLVEALEAYEKGYYFTALKEIQEAQINDPDNATLHFMTGLINLKTDRIDAAIDGFHKVELLGGQNYLSNYQLGKYYLEEGKSKNDDGALTLARFYLELCEQMFGDDIFLLSLLSDLYTVLNDQPNVVRIQNLIANQ